MCETIEEELGRLNKLLVTKTSIVLTDQARHRIRECFMKHATGLPKGDVIFLGPGTDLTVMAQKGVTDGSQSTAAGP